MNESNRDIFGANVENSEKDNVVIKDDNEKQPEQLVDQQKQNEGSSSEDDMDLRHLD